ncbi:MAG: L-rhamnose mutarotase [Verrucomicrobiales bacterium]
MTKRLLTLLASVLFLPACFSLTKAPERHCWVTGLKPEKAAYYRELHAKPWPSVAAQIKRSHIRNFSIHEVDIHGKTYLVAYLEYSGDNFEEDMKKMAADPETQRWWKETDPCQSPLPQAAKAGKIWADTEEIFYLE